QDDGTELVGLDGPAQEAARTKDMLLPDEFIQGARPHARGQGRILAALDLGGRTRGGFAFGREDVVFPIRIRLMDMPARSAPGTHAGKTSYLESVKRGRCGGAAPGVGVAKARSGGPERGGTVPHLGSGCQPLGAAPDKG